MEQYDVVAEATICTDIFEIPSEPSCRLNFNRNNDEVLSFDLNLMALIPFPPTIMIIYAFAIVFL